MVANEEPGNAVVGVGNDLAALRKDAHLQALLVFGRAHVGRALPLGRHLGGTQGDGLLGLGMQRQRQIQRRGRRLAGVVIGRAADAAAREHHVARGKAAPVGGHQRIALVGQEFRPAQLHATRGKQFDDLGEMLVLPAARQDFVADDDEADAAGDRFCSHVRFQIEAVE